MATWKLVEIESLEAGLAATADAIRSYTGLTETITWNATTGFQAAVKTISPYVPPVLQEKTVTTNGEVIPDAEYDGLSKVIVNVPDREILLQEKMTAINGEIVADEGYDGLSKVIVNVPEKEFHLQDKIATINGTIVADEGYDGLNSVTVNVESGKGLWEYAKEGVITEWIDNDIVVLKPSPFTECTSLTKISCENLTTLYPTAFAGNTNLVNVYLPNLTTLTSFEAYEWNVNAVGSYFANCTSLTTISLPNLITVTGNHLFFRCTNLTSVYLPNMVDLRYGTFVSCDNLIDLDLPSVTAIKNNAPIASCSKLRTLKLPALTSTSMNVCSSCPALEIVDFTALTTMSKGTCFSGSEILKALILRNSSTVVSLGSTFSTTDGIGLGTGYIYVPSALIENYKAATNWSTYAAQFRALEDYTVDGTITGELDETKI